jgi:D-3-phosphoglycerate dehydrogenase
MSQRALAVLQASAEVECREIPVGGLAAELASYDAVWIRLAHKLGADAFVAAGRCKAIACPVTGLDHLDLSAAAAAKVQIVSLKGEVEFLKTVRATAELTLALMLSLLRQVPQAAASVKAGQWARDLFRGHELYGKTVGLVGVGRLGAIVAGYLRAFGARVVGYDIRSDFPEGVERCDALEELLGMSDIVSIHVSLDARTKGMFGVAQFAAMRPGSWFVNTARGPVVDEAALLTALEKGQLAGAALDVLTGEPDVDARHPVVRYAQAHPNLLVVPHIGGNTFESFEKTEVFIANKLIEALRG